jgi:hypothetical protein
MVTDAQVRKLRRLFDDGKSLAHSSRKAGMDEKTARKYRKAGALPSQLPRNQRTWRTREDPFAEVWPEVEARLEEEPRLRPFALFAWLQEQYPGRFPDSQRRTFERRVRGWRGSRGPGQEVMFPQVHPPGDLAASDFTSMNSLNITIAGQRFDHLLYHFTLTYSNWETVSICFSESFEAISRGLQDAFWELGGIPRRHRTDSLSAAVNNLSAERDFAGRYRELLSYYRVTPQRINARKAHENGDVESSHGHLKTAIDQALLLRGSRDFASREEYEQFLRQLIAKRNLGRKMKFQQELSELGDLPPSRLDHVQRVTDIRVRRGSTIQVKRNTYSVPSRLIGHQVDVVIDADHIEVLYADEEIQRMPRLFGAGKHAINYRHVIDSLVRKPGAFENYKYQEHMFPSSHFRMAYDALLDRHSSRVAAREYLKILELAARDSEDAVRDALRVAIDGNEPISFEAVKRAVETHQEPPSITDVSVEPPNLNDFDSLLEHPDMEVECDDRPTIEDGAPECHGENTEWSEGGDCGEGPQAGRALDGPVSRTSATDVSGQLPEARGAGRQGNDGPRLVSGRTHGTGMPGAAGESDQPTPATIAASPREDLGQLRLESAPCPSGASDADTPRRLLPGPPGKPFAVWEAGFGEEPLPCCTGRTIGASGAFDPVHHL